MPTYGHFVGTDGPLLVSGEAEYIADHDLDNGVEMESYWFGFNIGKRINADTSVFGYVGIVNFENIDTVRVEAPFISTLSYDTDYGLAYGGGVLHEFKEYQLLDGEKPAVLFGSANTRFTKVDTDGASHIASGSTLTSNSADLTYLEWQVSLGVKQELTIFGHVLPLFFGVTYNDVFVDLGGNTIFNVPNTSAGNAHPETVQLFDESAADILGGFVGISIPIDDDKSLSFEGRFINETAASVEGTVRF